MESEILKIATNKLYAAAARPWTNGLRRSRSAKHYIFFRLDQHEMFVSRVVHTSMDLNRIHLPLA